MLEVLELTRGEFEKLERFPLIKGTLESESDLYYVPGNHKRIIKVYKNYRDVGYVMGKMHEIDNLIRYTTELNFPELLVPDGKAMIDGYMLGPTMPVIPGYTAKIYFYTFYSSVKVKVEILRKIGMLLEKIRLTSPKYNAAFADVHADNFIIPGFPSSNIKFSPYFRIVACDTDSMKLIDSPGVTGLYLADSDKFMDYEKYPLDDDYMVMPSSNTDIYCYIMMTLELIAKSNYVSCLNEDEYYRYLDFLDKLGFDHKLLESFASIYDDTTDNISPLPYIDAVLKMNNKSTLLNFYKTRTLKK